MASHLSEGADGYSLQAATRIPKLDVAGFAPICWPQF
jgi:hypothetical protein